jgi:hypothetical protein
MYQQILLAIALQRWDTPSPHALAARGAAGALARAPEPGYQRSASMSMRISMSPT